MRSSVRVHLHDQTCTVRRTSPSPPPLKHGCLAACQLYEAARDTDHGAVFTTSLLLWLRKVPICGWVYRPLTPGQGPVVCGAARECWIIHVTQPQHIAVHGSRETWAPSRKLSPCKQGRRGQQCADAVTVLRGRTHTIPCILLLSTAVCTCVSAKYTYRTGVQHRAVAGYLSSSGGETICLVAECVWLGRASKTSLMPG
jgi:hypothetical protein